MKKHTEIMDCGGLDPIDVNEARAVEVVTRVAFGPDSSRIGRGHSSVTRRYEVFFTEDRELEIYDKQEHDFWHNGKDSEQFEDWFCMVAEHTLVFGTVSPEGLSK